MKAVGVAVCLFMSALVLHLVGYINTTLYGFDNLLIMTGQVLKVRWKKKWQCAEKMRYSHIVYKNRLCFNEGHGVAPCSPSH